MSLLGQKVENHMLTPILRSILKDESASSIDFESEVLQGGTLGDVYLIKGTGKHDDSDNSAEMKVVNWSAVLKIQKEYHRFGDPESWRREMLLYQSNLFEHLPDHVKVPRCYGLEEHDDKEIWLWLEMVLGSNGTQFSLEDYAVAARHLAHFQGQFLTKRTLPSYPWLSSQYLLVKTISDWGTQAIPWLQRNHVSPIFSKNMMEGAMTLWTERDKLLDVYYSLPRTFCHRDFSAGNLFVSKTAEDIDQTTIIDWDCAGIGIAGEDIADLVGEALVFYDFHPAEAVRLEETVLSSYLLGLKEAGWSGDEKLIRHGYSISLVLGWCFRIICRAQHTENREVLERYASILNFIMERAEGLRKLFMETKK